MHVGRRARVTTGLLDDGAEFARHVGQGRVRAHQVGSKQRREGLAECLVLKHIGVEVSLHRGSRLRFVLRFCEDDLPKRSGVHVDQGLSPVATVSTAKNE